MIDRAALVLRMGSTRTGRFNYETLFELDLRSWYTDEGLWPKERAYELFWAWFDVECHSVVYGLDGGLIHDEDTE